MTIGRRLVPWWVRIGLKIVLSRLPIPYKIWKKLRVFEHGSMNEPGRAIKTFLHHARTGRVLDAEEMQFEKRSDSEGHAFRVLELGPGDSLASAMIAKALGATEVALVDVGRYATGDLVVYRQTAEHLRSIGLHVAWDRSVETVEQLVKACGARYYTNGLEALHGLPSSYFDYCFSNAVLEHISRHEFPKLALELRRVVSRSGTSVHRIDLSDHLGGALNNLRFSSKIWESNFMRSSGFYTNRIRYREYVEAFEAVGFEVDVAKIDYWPVLPTPRSKMHTEFQAYDDKELLVRGFNLVLH